MSADPGITHEERACALLRVIADTEDSDDYMARRKALRIAEADAHATLAVAASLGRIAKAVESISRMGKVI